MDKVTAKAQQRSLLQTAETACLKLKEELTTTALSTSTEAHSEPGQAVMQELDALADNFNGLRKLVANQEVSAQRRLHLAACSP